MKIEKRIVKINLARHLKMSLKKILIYTLSKKVNVRYLRLSFFFVVRILNVEIFLFATIRVAENELEIK